LLFSPDRSDTLYSGEQEHGLLKMPESSAPKINLGYD